MDGLSVVTIYPMPYSPKTSRNSLLGRDGIHDLTFPEATFNEHRNEKKKGLKQKILHELIKYWLIVLQMAIFFGAFSSYRMLLLADHGIQL